MEKKVLIKELLKHRYAHRGLHDKPKVAENSMTAFKLAVSEGFGIELDVHLTRDNNLAVIHDPSLKRTCGIDLQIEELDLSEAQMYFLEESRDTIPDFEEVLEMVDGRIPLIIELKVVDDNYDAICRRVAGILRNYKGMFCVESFDPRAVKWFKDHEPQFVRGQLAAALRKTDPEFDKKNDFLLKSLLVNFYSKPDFVAYRFDDRDERGIRKYKGPKFFWTITDYADMKEVEAMGGAAIFEQFNPKNYEK